MQQIVCDRRCFTIANFCFIYIHYSCWSYASGRIARRPVPDIEVVQSGTAEKVGILISTLSYFVPSYVVAFMKAPKTASYLIKLYATRINSYVDTATITASSSLSHLPLVYAFSSNDRLIKLFSVHLLKSRKDGRKKAGTHVVQLAILYFIAYSSNALAFWAGFRPIAEPVECGQVSVSVGAVYNVIFILIDSSFILSQVAPFIHMFAAAVGTSARLQSVINRNSLIDGTSDEGDKSASFLEEGIVFRDVFFSYPSRPDVAVLNGSSLTIPPRQHTTIEGPSSGGKYTVVSLLERFYDSASGELRFGSRHF
ncbi:multidrug resistance 3 (p glycoprotein 3) [Fusarium sp. NRRL 25303]|nr:multidrug resistance 3 (p glycoprotein 3) [Fusarium sp. NRRL 25303]